MKAPGSAGWYPRERDSAQAWRAFWWWLDPEWAESQAKPQLTFVCHGLGSGVNPRPTGQRSPSCRNNNNRADSYTWAHIHTPNVFKSVEQLTSPTWGSDSSPLLKTLSVQPLSDWAISKKLAVKNRFHCLPVRFAKFGQTGPLVHTAVRIDH